MKYRVHSVEMPGVEALDVAFDQAQARIFSHLGERVRAKMKTVIHSHRSSGPEQFADQWHPYKPGSAGDQDMFCYHRFMFPYRLTLNV